MSAKPRAGLALRIKDTGKGTSEPLLSILSLQRAKGGIELNEDVASLLGIDLKRIRQAAKEIQVGLKVNRFLLLSTAILLEVLESKLAADRPAWDRIVRKSADWLTDMVKRGNPAIHGENLTDWARQYVRENVTI